MSLKTRLRVSIIGLVTAVALALSALNLNRLTEVEFQDSADRAQMIALEVQGSLEQILNRRMQATPGARTGRRCGACLDLDRT